MVLVVLKWWKCFLNSFDDGRNYPCRFSIEYKKQSKKKQHLWNWAIFNLLVDILKLKCAEYKECRLHALWEVICHRAKLFPKIVIMHRPNWPWMWPNIWEFFLRQDRLKLSNGSIMMRWIWIANNRIFSPTDVVDWLTMYLIHSTLFMIVFIRIFCSATFTIYVTVRGMSSLRSRLLMENE